MYSWAWTIYTHYEESCLLLYWKLPIFIKAHDSINFQWIHKFLKRLTWSLLLGRLLHFWVNKPMLNIGYVSNETNEDVRMYTWRIYSSRYLDTLLYMDEVDWDGTEYALEMQYFIYTCNNGRDSRTEIATEGTVNTMDRYRSTMQYDSLSTL